ncbi:MAG: hypothetical protein J6Q80_06635, partial [Lentisphaeria bacterium]|nr:hypothetical protein [Lentisphaeria bacterium]
MKRECFQQLYDFAGVSKGVKHFCNASAFDELFVIQMRDYVGNPYLFRVEDFPDLTYSVSGNSFNMKFSGVVLLAGTTVEVTVSRDDKSVLYWNIFITPGRDDFKVEWVNFPRVVFSSPGCKYLIPNAEGAEISDLADCQENGFFKCNLVEYPMTGTDSFYPGPAAMQFEALYDTVAGLYIGCHDKSDQPKVIDFYPEGKGGICVLQQFTGGAGTPGYAVEMHSFRGDWQDAADIYRNWLEKEQLMPEKLVDNMPEVLDAS